MNSVSLRRWVPLALGYFAAVSLPAQSAPAYEPNWASLNRHVTGDWFVQSRFGVAVQWSVASVPGQSRDYARLMYLPPEPTQPNAIWDYHLKRYGHPTQFGYKDLLPYWEAKTWDPKALAKLLKKTGAGYVVPVAIDRDNIDLFDSKFQPWNAKRFGPRRDVALEWAEALRAEGLRVGFSIHNGRAWDFLRAAQGAEWEGPQAEKPFDGALTSRDGASEWWHGLNPGDLYGPVRPGDAFAKVPPQQQQPPAGPDRAYRENWYKRASDLIASAKPDLVMIDGTLPHEDWGLRFAADFFSLRANDRFDRANAVALVTAPTTGAATGAFVTLGRARGLERENWLVELDLARDGIRTDVPPSLSVADVLQRLVDTASRGGNLLLRIALRADGTLPDDQAKVLSEVGAWLSRNGSTLNGSSAGPTLTGNSSVSLLRATRNGDKIFVFFPRWPGRTTLEIGGLSKPGGDAKWSDGTTAEFSFDNGRLTLQTPPRAPDALMSVLTLSSAPTQDDF